MRNLVPLNLDSYKEFINIVNAKDPSEKKSFLLAICEAIRQDYLLYDNFSHNLSAIPPNRYSDYSKECLKDCYNSETKPLTALKAELKAHRKRTTTPETFNQCQYCGIEKPFTIDHYLPQDLFPEYSVFTKNLIPCCFDCNNKKRAKFLDQSGNRLILNLYNDGLPNERYLDVDFEYTADGVKAKFKFIDNLPIDAVLLNLIKSHYKELDLFSRFEEISTGTISRLRISIQSFMCSSDMNLIKDRLLEESSRLFRIFSNNYWEAVLHEGLAKEDEFIKSCCVR